LTQNQCRISNQIEKINNENSYYPSNNNLFKNNKSYNISDDLDFQEVEEKDENNPVVSENLKQDIFNGLMQPKNHLNNEEKNNKSPSVIESISLFIFKL